VIAIRYLPLAVALSLTACQATGEPSGAREPVIDTGTRQPTSAEPVIRGSATYWEKIKMPPGTKLRIQLIDHLLADTPEAIVADVTMADVAGPPYEFALPYDPAELRPHGQYGLHASLLDAGGKLWFVTDTRIPVVPGDAMPVEFRMTRVLDESTARPPATRSPWEDARARGVVFRAVGNEPGWFVEVEGGKNPGLRATLDYGERTLEVPRVFEYSGLYGYHGKTIDRIDVRLTMKLEPCSDGMSDERYPFSARLAVGKQIYVGCGRYLRD